MLKLLVKKQLSEIFRSYFFDAKKKKMRSKGAVILKFVLFAVIMAGVLGSTFTFVSLMLVKVMYEFEMSWFYFIIMSGIAIILGAFGSVFNTYSGLYLAKDNDLLLSMPIPVKYIIFSRLLNVWLLGTMYSSVVILPAIIVYAVKTPVGARAIIPGIILLLIISAIVFILSALLGKAVAKISLKLKNKSLVTTIASLAFIVIYYVCYYKATQMLSDLIENVAFYGAKVRGAAYPLYLFGKIGEGDIKAILIYVAATALLLALTAYAVSKNFIGIATATGKTDTKKQIKKPADVKSPFAALLSKEFSKLVSSPNYMLNCALGVLVIPAMSVFLLLKGPQLLMNVGFLFSDKPGFIDVVCAAIVCMMASINDTAAPSVSLEGKSIWVLQSLPVNPAQILRAKMSVQIILTLPLVLFAGIVSAIISEQTLFIRILICLLPVCFSVFSAALNTLIAVRMPNLTWTNEIVPIKQSSGVLISVLSGWGYALILGGTHYFIGYKIPVALYLGGFIAITAAASCGIIAWLNKKGAEIFMSL